jgi:hypothetical protein
MVTSVDNLMSQRIAKWERRRQLARETAALAETQRPLVAISRELGSLGDQVARQVATSLDFDLYDKQLIEEIAQSAQVRAQVVESVGEQAQERITAWIGRQVDGGYFSSTDYLQHLSKVLLTVGQHGDAVLLGRGAQFILKPERTLRVRITAPFSLRASRVAASDRLSAQEAEIKVRTSDAARCAYCRWHFGEDTCSPQHYDLVLNSAFVSPANCAATIVRLYRLCYEED